MHVEKETTYSIVELSETELNVIRLALIRYQVHDDGNEIMCKYMVQKLDQVNSKIVADSTSQYIHPKNITN